MGRYWLAQCEGFRVQGPPNGTVEKVVGSVDEQSAESLVVRTAWRRCNVPVEAVDAVVPASRMIVVEDRSSEEAQPSLQRRTRALAEAGAHAAPLARYVRDVAVAIGLVAAAAIVMLGRGARAVAVYAAQLAAIAFARLTAPPRRPR